MVFYNVRPSYFNFWYASNTYKKNDPFIEDKFLYLVKKMFIKKGLSSKAFLFLLLFFKFIKKNKIVPHYFILKFLTNYLVLVKLTSARQKSRVLKSYPYILSIKQKISLSYKNFFKSILTRKDLNYFNSFIVEIFEGFSRNSIFFRNTYIKFFSIWKSKYLYGKLLKRPRTTIVIFKKTDLIINQSYDPREYFRRLAKSNTSNFMSFYFTYKKYIDLFYTLEGSKLKKAVRLKYAEISNEFTYGCLLQKQTKFMTGDPLVDLRGFSRLYINLAMSDPNNTKWLKLNKYPKVTKNPDDWSYTLNLFPKNKLKPTALVLSDNSYFRGPFYNRFALFEEEPYRYPFNHKYSARDCKIYSTHQRWIPQIAYLWWKPIFTNKDLSRKERRKLWWEGKKNINYEPLLVPPYTPTY